MAHLEKHNILTSRNHGFRSGFSCETQLITTTHDLLSSFDTNIQTDIAILDFSKAFDTVPHKKLLHKLDHYGVKGPLHAWLTTFLTQRSMKVVLEGEASDAAAVESGVPQGTVLGPILFLCHINDLPASVTSQVRLFADDCLLYREIHSFQDHIELQKDLDRLETWANNWGMKFNAKKCYILSIKPKTFKFYELNNTFLQQVPHSAYLGIQLSSDLTWKTHINSVTKKANSILGLLRRNLQKCPPNCKKIAYLSLVRSTLEYGSTIWDPYHKGEIEQLEIIQRRAARFITGDYKSRETGCVTNMLKQLDLPSLQERRRQLRLASFYKIVEGLVPALPADQYLTPIPGSKRTIKATSFPD